MPYKKIGFWKKPESSSDEEIEEPRSTLELNSLELY
jgi:hypothetical protein